MTLLEVADGIRLDVQDVGAGPPVVLVPGVGMTHAVFDRQVRVLAAAGHRVVCVDQRGHGASDKPFDGYGLDVLAGDLAAVLAALDLRDATVVGWSLGAQVALRLAVDGEARIGRLVLVSSNGVAAARTDAFPFGATADALLPGLLAAEHADRLDARRAGLTMSFGSPPDPDVVTWLLHLSLRMPSWTSLAISETLLRSCSADRLDKLRVPTLQIYGTQDPVFSMRGAAWLRERIPGLRSVVLDGCGHYPMLERPDEFDRALLDFLRDVPQALSSK